MRPAEVRAASVQVTGGRKVLTVCHVLTREVEALVSGSPEKQTEPKVQLRMYGAESVEYNRKLFASLFPQRTDINERLRRMEEMGSIYVLRF